MMVLTTYPYGVMEKYGSGIRRADIINSMKMEAKPG